MKLQEKTMRFLKGTGAFTIIELMVVIMIIIILMGLLSPALMRARQQARIQSTRALIGSLKIGCSMYYNDVGSYPTTLPVLATAPAPGPYVDPNSKYYVGGNFVDAWNRTFIYNAINANIISYGPDGVSGGGDDIYY